MPKKYIALNEVRQIIQEIRSSYPESIFPSPENGGDTPAAYFAKGTRLACDNILARIPEAGEDEDGEKKKK